MSVVSREMKKKKFLGDENQDSFFYGEVGSIEKDRASGGT